jgi:hypothetical protein
LFSVLCPLPFGFEMPRSPSRDLSDRYIGKRGYFRTPEPLRRLKYTLALLALVGAGAWVVIDAAGPSYVQHVQYAHTHGPLSNPHAAFDNNCGACHKSYSLKDAGLSAIYHARDRWHDFTCEKCHSGPIHHESANEAAREFHQRCSNCHHDHLGRLNSLVRLADKDCTQCHANLDQWHDPAKSKTLAEKKPYQNSITNFVTDHPDFRSLDMSRAGKQRALKFSHAVHMNPGLSTQMTLAVLNSKFGPEVTNLYRTADQDPKNDSTSLVTLDCASCHKLDSGIGTPSFDKADTLLNKFGDSTRTILPPRASGAYFLPVNFEAHCRTCHPLSAPMGKSSIDGKDVAISGFDVPHRRQPAEVLADVKSGYLKRMIAEKHPALSAPLGPGGRLDPPPTQKDTTAQTLSAEIDRLSREAEKKLFAPAAPGPARIGATAPGCLKCHEISGTGDARRIEPVPDRTVWFEHAKFNHASHRGVTCVSCHPGTRDPWTAQSTLVEKEPVQILGVASCRTCHSPERTKVTLEDKQGKTETTGGGIRHNCTDCHNYHHGDLPMQGRGSTTRKPTEPRDFKDWLKGN